MGCQTIDLETLDQDDAVQGHVLPAQRKPKTWTVVGVWLAGWPVVVGVIEGHHEVKGGTPMYAGDTFVEHINASDPETAQNIFLSNALA